MSGQLIALLTNGTDDILQIHVGIGSSAAVSVPLPDTHSSIIRAAELAGPDLIGATITGIGFRIDTADVSETTGTVFGALVVFGFPN